MWGDLIEYESKEQLRWEFKLGMAGKDHCACWPIGPRNMRHDHCCPVWRVSDLFYLSIFLSDLCAAPLHPLSSCRDRLLTAIHEGSEGFGFA